MSKFTLKGDQVDLVRSLAIHQDWRALVEWIEDLVDQSKGVSDGQANDGATSSVAQK